MHIKMNKPQEVKDNTKARNDANARWMKHIVRIVPEKKKNNNTVKIVNYYHIHLQYM